MLGQIMLCALTACGLIVLLWVLIGFLLLPFSPKDGCMLLSGETNQKRLEQQVRAFAWLLGSGLVRTRLVLVDDGTDPERSRLLQHLAEEYSWVSCCMRDHIEAEIR